MHPSNFISYEMMIALTREMCRWCNFPPSNSWWSNQRCILINGILESKKYCNSSWGWWQSCNIQEAEVRGISVSYIVRPCLKTMMTLKKILWCQIALISLLDTNGESHNSLTPVKSLIILRFYRHRGKRTMWKPRLLQTQLQWMLPS